MKPHLLYLSYGEGIHEAEVGFSILTARHQEGCSGDGPGILVFTDRPDSFHGLPAEIVTVSAARWAEWSGPFRYQHRRKIPALAEALRLTNAPVVLVDGDTWWRRPPSTLFRGILPGHALMHLREARVDRVNTPGYRKLCDFLRSTTFRCPDGSEERVSESSWMWNAGVVGMHPDDAALLDEVCRWTDRFCEAGCDVHVLEQFAFSLVLGRRTALREAVGHVFHYWPPYLHAPFRTRVRDLMNASAHLPLAERAAWCFARRPRPSIPRRLKVVAKRALQALGVIRGRIRSSEW